MLPHVVGSFDLGILGTLAGNVAADLGAAAIGAAVFRVRGLIANRRLWSLRDPSTVVIFVAESARTLVKKSSANQKKPSDPLAEYVRAATGIGQVRALAAIAPSLRVAYRKLDLTTVRMAGDGLGGEQSKDVISLGGRKNSAEVTGRILDELGRTYDLHVESHGDWVAWRDSDDDVHAYEPTAHVRSSRPHDAAEPVKESQIDRDYGILVKAPNPWDDRSTVIVFAGASTYGTAAAASFFVTKHRWRRPHHFEALVEVSVVSGHGGTPKLRHISKLRKPPRA